MPKGSPNIGSNFDFFIAEIYPTVDWNFDIFIWPWFIGEAISQRFILPYVGQSMVSKIQVE
jgi:hypothetical protein